MTTLILNAYTLPMQRGVALFHDRFGHPNLIVTPAPLPLDRIKLRLILIEEEGVDELREGIENGDEIEIIDALIDTIYVSLGALVEMGEDAGDLLSIEGSVADVHPAFLGESLITTARDSLSVTRVHLVLLEKAFLRQDAGYAASILRVIIARALLALKHARIDPQPFFDEVQRSNMSKLGADGNPVLSRGPELDGKPLDKVIKGPNYFEPDIAGIYARLYPERIIAPSL
jgi:predicted HAD superfamily Cof-like phosphohydrolase